MSEHRSGAKVVRSNVSGEPAEGNGRKVVIAAVVFLVLLVLAVVVPLVVIGLHNNGATPPPNPAPTRSVPISTP